jgi:hypothetical protein
VELSFVLKDPLYDYEIFIQLKNVRKKSTFLQYEILQGIPIKLIEMLISEIDVRVWHGKTHYFIIDRTIY